MSERLRFSFYRAVTESYRLPRRRVRRAPRGGPVNPVNPAVPGAGGGSGATRGEQRGGPSPTRWTSRPRRSSAVCCRGSWLGFDAPGTPTYSSRRNSLSTTMNASMTYRRGKGRTECRTTLIVLYTSVLGSSTRLNIGLYSHVSFVLRFLTPLRRALLRLFARRRNCHAATRVKQRQKYALQLQLLRVHGSSFTDGERGGGAAVDRGGAGCGGRASGGCGGGEAAAAVAAPAAAAAAAAAAAVATAGVDVALAAASAALLL
eukprot:scaffold81510_cov69-Phaeocystis_antarctica.AAC.2